MTRLIALVLVSALIAPNVAASAACCHAPGASAAAQLVQDGCCCPHDTACAISPVSCDPQLHGGLALARVDPAPLFRAALMAFSPVTIRSWWTRKVRLASTDPPESFHPLISLPLRL